MADDNDIVFNQYSVDFFTYLNYLFERLFGGAGGGGVVSGSSWSPSDLIAWFASLWSFLVVLSWFLSFLFIFGLVYAYIRGNQLAEVVSEVLKNQEIAYAKLNQSDVKNNRWSDVLAHIDSDRENDWKLAIIEADILLEELLESVGYAGITVGDKLKSASPTSFTTINQAWRAHNVRNRIAHEGADFTLSQKAAQETIAQYKMVFEEFDFI